MSQLEKRIKQIERENAELIRENSELVDTVRRLSSVIDEQYILIAQYVSVEAAEGLAPLFQTMRDVAPKVNAVSDDIEG